VGPLISYFVWCLFLLVFLAFVRYEVTGENPSPWSTEEQQLLEQALKTYPAALGAER
jgi:hypothetical protein